MRQFILDKQTIKNGVIKLIGKDYKYLRQVLRVKVGDMLNVRKPDGELAGSTVASIDDKAKIITLQLCGNVTSDASVTRGVGAEEIQNVMNGRDYYLFQFIPKAQKFEQIVRQATECGIKKIIPIIGEYSEKSAVSALENSKQERLDRIIKEARQQSGSPVDTKIEKPVNLEEAIEKFESSDESKELQFVLSERTDFSESITKVLNNVENLENIQKIIIAVGSEGGISTNEISVLREKALFHAIHFDVNILRCETAALYGIAAIQTAINEKSSGGENNGDS